MVRFCSDLVCEINSSKEFITQNLSKIGAFLAWIKKSPKIFDRAQKWSDFAEIWCDEIFSWVDFTHQIWAKSDHFWQSWKITFWALTLSAHFGENWNITSVDLTYVKFQVIWSWNQLKNQNFHERKNFSSSLTLALLGYIGGVMPPYIPPWGGWRVNSSWFLI